MLNKPKFMRPSINMHGNTSVDMNDNSVLFSCTLDGNEAIYAWQIQVFTLETNDIVYDTGKKELETPFFPINNRNQNVVFDKDLKKYTSIIPKEFKNDAQPYYWVISFWNKTDKDSISPTITSCEEVFYANSKPTIEFYYSYDNNFLDNEGKLNDELRLTEDTNIEKRKVYLKANYSQAEGVALKRYGWRITSASDGNTLVDNISQNQVYGASEDITCECNGLLDDAFYPVELYIETQSGWFDIYGAETLRVEYDVKDLGAGIDVVPLEGSSGIMLDWGKFKTTEGVVIGNPVTYESNFPIKDSVSANIPDGSKIVFSKTGNGQDLNIDENSYVVLSTQFEKNKDLTLLEISGVDNSGSKISRKLYYNYSDGKLHYEVLKGETKVEATAEISGVHGSCCWYVISLHPLSVSGSDYTTALEVSESQLKNSTFPSSTLYPSVDTFPYLGEWDKIRNEV